MMRSRSSVPRQRRGLPDDPQQSVRPDEGNEEQNDNAVSQQRTADDTCARGFVNFDGYDDRTTVAAPLQGYIRTICIFCSSRVTLP